MTKPDETKPKSPRQGCQVVRTRGGAMAVRDVLSGEVMHPMGPAQEAQDVYIGPCRLEARLREGGAPLVLLDVGLGAGTNALAAFAVSASLPVQARRLEIVSFEHDLAALELALEPENAEGFGLAHAALREAATALLRHGRFETSRTLWRMRLGDVMQELALEPEASADVAFWDMFSSKADPMLWSATAFRALYRVCRQGATVHTYSAATPTRSALLLAGFAVGMGNSTGHRAQTTVAALHPSDLREPLGARWLARLSRSTAPFPADVPQEAAARAEALRQIAQCPQFAPLAP
jgi:queuine tRNA-ribosyltransferase